MKRPSSLSSVWLNTYSVCFFFLPRILQTESAFSRPTPDRSTNRFRRDCVEVVKSGEVFVSVVHWGEILLPRPVEMIISTMQMCDLHRRLAQLSSQTSHKQPDGKHAAMKGVLYLKGSRLLFICDGWRDERTASRRSSCQSVVDTPSLRQEEMISECKQAVCLLFKSRFTHWSQTCCT